MSNFIVSARKYRPSTFNSVVGQKSITSTLKNAIQKQKLAHAYLFFGPRGVGKTTCARIFAKTINCMSPSSEMEACNECVSCKGFNESRSYNIHELDAASNNSVEDIRNLIEQVRIPPQIGKYSTYIIDEVHMLSLAAFNAFLKTLEEPPAHAIFILATTEKHKIIPTILSRCQIFDFNRIEVADMVDHLTYIAKQEGVDAEPEALNIIANKADGAMRDALSIYDQIASYSGSIITYQQVIENLNVLDYEYYFQLTATLIAGDYGKSLLILDEILGKGFDGHHFLVGLAKHFRDLLVCRDPQTVQLLEVGASIKQRYIEQSTIIDLGFAFEVLRICNHFDIHYKSSKNTRLHIELALLQIISQAKKKSNKLDDNEQKLSTGNQSEPLPSRDGKEINPVLQAEKPKLESQPIEIDSEKPKASAEVNLQLNESRLSNDKKKSASIPSLDALLLSKPKYNQTAADESTQKKTENTPDQNQAIGFDGELNSENLKPAWIDFLSELQEDEPRLHSSLQVVEPEIIGNHTLKLRLANRSIIESFEPFRSRFKERLIKELGLENLEIILEMDAETSNNFVYTTEDKFQFLIKKNPSLLKLKQKLGLDFD